MNTNQRKALLAAAKKLVWGIEPRAKPREGLRETPLRVAKYWEEMTSGYDVDIGGLFKTFEDGTPKSGDLVIVSDIPFVSSCEHHLALFHGHAWVGYIPCGRVVGLSKIARLVDAYGRRLQVQERMTAQIADAMVEHLQPAGVMVVLRAKHSCMMARGARTEALTTTSAVRGVLESDPAARAEFLSLAFK